MRVRRGVVAVVLAAGALGAGPAAAWGQDEVTLRVMTYNMAGGEWNGGYEPPGSPGTQHEVAAAANAIRAAGADVVGLQEPFGRTRQLAALLGPEWHAYPALHTIARHRILAAPETRGRFGYLELAPGHGLVVVNSHLPSDRYGPDLVVAGKRRRAVLRNERALRMGWLERILLAADNPLDAGLPAVFTADFNAPSWRDWTAAPVAARDLPFTVRWPVSRAVEAAGFTDTFRAVHRDPVAVPGTTWTTGYPSFQTRGQISDRIDNVYASGAAIISSELVGEGPPADIVVRPWISDHRAVVTTVRVRPAELPPILGLDSPRIAPGEPIEATVAAPAGQTVRVWSGPDVVREVPAAARMSIPTAGLPPGSYLVTLSGASFSPLEIVAPDAERRVEVTRRTVVGVGEPIQVHWVNGEGNRYDWLSVNRAGRPPRDAPPRAWRYVGGLVAGYAQIHRRHHGRWPLRPGRYDVSLCTDDGYVCSRPSTFRVAR